MTIVMNRLMDCLLWSASCTWDDFKLTQDDWKRAQISINNPSISSLTWQKYAQAEERNHVKIDVVANKATVIKAFIAVAIGSHLGAGFIAGFTMRNFKASYLQPQPILLMITTIALGILGLAAIGVQWKINNLIREEIITNGVRSMRTSYLDKDVDLSHPEHMFSKDVSRLFTVNELKLWLKDWCRNYKNCKQNERLFMHVFINIKSINPSFHTSDDPQLVKWVEILSEIGKCSVLGDYIKLGGESICKYTNAYLTACASFEEDLLKDKMKDNMSKYAVSNALSTGKFSELMCEVLQAIAEDKDYTKEQFASNVGKEWMAEKLETLLKEPKFAEWLGKQVQNMPEQAPTKPFFLEQIKKASKLKAS